MPAACNLPARDASAGSDRRSNSLHSAADRRSWAALTAAAIGLVAAIVAFVGPAQAHRTRISWQPARDGLERPLALLASHPEHLRFALDCDTVRALERKAVLFKTTAAGVISGGLEVSAGAGDVRARVGGTNRSLTLPIPSEGPCTVTVRFDALDDAEGELSLDTGSRATAMPIAFVRPGEQTTPGWPRVTGLHADAALVDASDVRVDLETRPWGSTPGTSQIIAGVVAALALALAAALLLRPVRRKPADASVVPEQLAQEEPARSPRLAGSDVFIFTVGVAALVVAPPVWDDGWVRATVDTYSSLGVFSDYYTLADFGHPVGYWWQLLLRPWFGLGDALVVSRLVPLLLILGSWWVLRRVVLDKVLAPDDRKFGRAIAALLFAVGAVAFMISLRPEPLAALLLICAIGAVLRFARVQDVPSLVPIAVLAALAGSMHQTGVVVPFAVLAVIPSAWRWCRAAQTASRVVTLAAVGVLGLALTVLLVGVDTDLGLARQALAGFRAHAAYRTGVVENAIRRIDILRTAGTLHRLWPLLALLSVAGFLVIGRGVKHNLARLAGYSAAMAYVGLLVTSSFWPSHFGALIPAAALLGAITVTRILLLPRGRTAWLVGLGVVTAALVAWSMQSTEKLGVPGELTELSWRDLPHLETWHWIALATAAAGVGALCFRRRGASVRTRGAVLASASFLLVAPLVLTAGLFVADTARDPRWSFGLENLKALSGHASCGAADELEVVTATTPFTEVSIGRWPIKRATANGFPSFSRPAAVPPVPDTWGTYDPTGAPTAVGRVATPWFDVSGQSEVVYWSVGDATSPNRLRAEVVAEPLAGERRRVALPAERPLDTPWWAFHHVQLPEHARAVRLVMTDRGTSAGEWLAVTAPVIPTYSSFTAVTEGEEVWRDPWVWYAMPCRSLPAATGGVIQPFRWSLEPPGSNGAEIVEEFPTIERGCLFPDRRGWPELRARTPESAARFVAPRLCAYEFILPEQ